MNLLRVMTLAVFGITIAILVGCSGGAQTPSAQAEPVPSEPGPVAEEVAAPAEATLAERQAALDEREKQLAEREAALAKPRPSGRTPAPAAPPTSPASQTTEPATRTPTPIVERVALSVPAGTMFDVEILDGVSSETSVVGDRFRARLVGDMVADGKLAVPADSVVHGWVTEVRSAKKIGGQAMLAIDFDTLELPSGDSTAFRASLAQTGKKQTGKDAATIGGATAGGALLGRLLDKKHGTKGTLIGAVVGAAVGTAIAAKNEGDPVMLDSGAVIGLTLDEPVSVVLEDGRPAFETVASR